MPISDSSAYLGRDFFSVCDLNSFMIVPNFTSKRNMRIDDLHNLLCPQLWRS